MNILKSFLIIMLNIQQIMACTCIGETSIADDIKNSKMIFKGMVIQKDTLTIYNSDTILIQNYYNDLGDKKQYKSYKDYKELVWGTKILEYTIKNIEVYKGRNKFDFIKIRTGFGGGDCGYEFAINETYLIFANNAKYLKNSKNRHKSKWRKIKNIYETNICMRTKLFSESNVELKILN